MLVALDDWRRSRFWITFRLRYAILAAINAEEEVHYVEDKKDLSQLFLARLWVRVW